MERVIRVSGKEVRREPITDRKPRAQSPRLRELARLTAERDAARRAERNMREFLGDDMVGFGRLEEVMERVPKTRGFKPSQRYSGQPMMPIAGTHVIVEPVKVPNGESRHDGDCVGGITRNMPVMESVVVEYTVKQLREHAAHVGLKGVSRMKKDDLVKLLSEHCLEAYGETF